MSSARVTIARIESPYVERKDRGLGLALVPGMPVERFNRTWRLEVSREIVQPPGTTNRFLP